MSQEPPQSEPLRNENNGSDSVTPIGRLRDHTGHTDWTKCATCGADLYVKAKGRPRDYCSPACRQEA